jgi:DNA repair protein RadC
MKELKVPGGIKTWAEDDRPREKLLLKGKQALSDAELLAILIGSGTKDQSAVDVSKILLQLGKNNLNQLGKLDIADLTQVPGIGPAKAITIIAALELGRRRAGALSDPKMQVTSSRDVYQAIKPHLADKNHEEFWVLLLSRSNKIKEKKCISSGGISGTVVDQRLIFKPAMQSLASAIILVHNHPSGTLRPSEQDKTLTRKLVASGKILDIPVLDHLIYTDEGYYSFADEGMI